MSGIRRAGLFPTLAAMLCAGMHCAAFAETPGELVKPGTYEGSMRQQREFDAQQQQFRDQSRLQQRQFDADWNSALKRNQAQQNAAAAQGQNVLRTWQNRPPLAPDHNPLLGRWQSKAPGGAARTSGQDMAALAQSLLGGMTAAMCDNMLGHGAIEFRPTMAVTIGADGRERVLYHAEYRGGGTRVVVLPKDAGTFTHMIVDFDRPDHGVVAAVGCVLARPGAAAAATASARAGPGRDKLTPTRADAGEQPPRTR